MEPGNPSLIEAGIPEDNVDPAPELGVLVVGQTPPPYHGQALMIQMMLNGSYKNARLMHVRMAFSRDISQVGRFAWRKVGHLMSVILRIYWARIRHRLSVLYYPPAGPDLVPMLRDLVVLLSVRWLFRKTIFHFHSAGVSTLLPRLPLAVGFLFRAAYFHANVAVRLSEYLPVDGSNMMAARELIVQNAVEDAAAGCVYKRQRDGDSPTILFVGAMKESKGVRVLLDACALLQQSGLLFRLKLVGEFESEEFDSVVRADLRRTGIVNKVDIPGVLIGPEKWGTYARADIFCLPSFVEALPLALIEAMQFSLPIVASHCGGIPSLVEDGLNGYLVAPKDATATAERLAMLVLDADLRARMGISGRRRYEQRYMPERFYEDLDHLFGSLVR